MQKEQVMEKYIYKSDVYTAEFSSDGIGIFENGDRLCRLVPTTRVLSVAVADDDILDARGRVKVKAGEHYDVDDDGEVIVSFKAESESKFVWEAKSSLWERKTYTAVCDPEGINYYCTVYGKSNIGVVQYFRTSEGGSHYDFCEYYFPCPPSQAELKMRRSSAEEFLSFFELMIPPAYVYSFRTEEHHGRFGLGLIANPGEYNFMHYDYRKCGDGTGRTCFYFQTDLEGHTKTDGSFTLPYIRTFFGKDDIAVIKNYCAYHYDNGLAHRKERRPEDFPRWWRGPIVCGWNEQGVLSKTDYKGTSQKNLATQEVYTRIADMIRDYDIPATMLIIDDKWQKGYGNAVPDPEKWPDMRGFVDEMHSRGLRVILWFRMWGGEGLPEDEVMGGGGMLYNNRRVKLDYPPYSDPTNPKYAAHLREMVHYLLSPDEGCMNADGFKLDYTLVQPYGETAESFGGQYGAESTKMLYDIIYSAAKEAKPDALINGSPCHPYFDEVCDMARVHDYGWEFRNETEAMRERASLFSAVMDGVLIDTDSANFASRSDAMRYYRNQPKIGVPDIYQFSNSPMIEFTKEDIDEIRDIFKKYAAQTDEKYGAVEEIK